MRRRRRGPRRGATVPPVRELKFGASVQGVSYHRDDLLLDQRRKRDELKEERKVELYSVSSIPPRVAW